MWADLGLVLLQLKCIFGDILLSEIELVLEEKKGGDVQLGNFDFMSLQKTTKNHSTGYLYSFGCFLLAVSLEPQDVNLDASQLLC